MGTSSSRGWRAGGSCPPETIADRLRAVRAPLGVYAVLGNHDWWLDAPRVMRAFKAAGISTLEDAAVRIPRNGDAVWLVGVSDFWEGPHEVTRALSPVADAAPIVAMTHNPDVFPSIPQRVCLTLAGHTHGGQVALPLIGRPIVPSHYGERYAAGEIVEARKHLFVTTGIGTSIFPVRFRVRPELVMLRVTSAR